VGSPDLVSLYVIVSTLPDGKRSIRRTRLVRRTCSGFSERSAQFLRLVRGGAAGALRLPPLPSATRPLDELCVPPKHFRDPSAVLPRGTRMGHEPRTGIVGVAEVGHGPTSVDGDVAQFRAELEREPTT